MPARFPDENVQSATHGGWTSGHAGILGAGVYLPGHRSTHCRFWHSSRTSLVIDTPDRRIPYQPWALELKKDIVDRFISPLASCFPPGMPRHVIAPASHQILQMPGYVVHLLEYSHAYRVIPTAAGPHVPGPVKLWQGDSRGRWEDNTLVVDVTNSNGLTWFDNAGNFFSDAVHVVERFTLIDADTIP
jgi:hypothetical protein